MDAVKYFKVVAIYQDKPTFGLNNSCAYIAFRSTDEHLNIMGIASPGEFGPTWRGMMLFTFLQVVFDVNPNLKVHFSADPGIWNEGDLIHNYNAKKCVNWECDPHHFPHDNGEPYYFTWANFVLLWKSMLDGKKSLSFLSKTLFSGIEPTHNLNTICRSFKDLAEKNPKSNLKFDGLEDP